MSVAMLWILTIGEEQKMNEDESFISDRADPSQLTTQSSVACFIHGLSTLIAQLLSGQALSFGGLFLLPFNCVSDSTLSDSS